MESVVRDKLFISYSHRDKDWFERFERMLKPVANAENLCVVWSDKEIKPGEPWDDKITRALESSKIALLLVSSSFLASDYVNKSELPAIIGAHAEKGLGIFWVLLEQALFDFGPLKNIQAASSVDISLAEITDDGVRMAAIAKICRQIGNELGQYSSMEQSSRYDLKREVQKVLPDSITLEDEAGAGAFTIVYFATSIKDGDRLVVKAAAPSPLDDWDIKSIKEHLTKARTLSHASFIRIYDTRLQDKPLIMIMERIDGPTLKEVLRRGGAMKPRRVAGILQQIASALSNVHDLGLVYGSLHSSSLFLLEKDDLLKLSVIDLSNEVMLSERMRGSIVTSYEMLNYMTPEVYIGGLVSQKSDQYYLGLLALEMLNGKPPVEISCIADLNKKETFFKEPRRYFGDWQTLEPGLARIIARSLSENPDARWPNMRSVAHMLQAVCDLAPADPFEDLIKTSYNKYCAGRTEFYRAFYERFFVKSPELREYFRQIDLDRQYGMLDDAVALLTNFHPEPWREPTALSRTKRIHAGLGLEKKHYEEFTSAFIETVRAIGEEDKDTLNAWACLFERGTDYLISAEV